jgi:hypothetical protein
VHFEPVDDPRWAAAVKGRRLSSLLRPRRNARPGPTFKPARPGSVPARSRR